VTIEHRASREERQAEAAALLAEVDSQPSIERISVAARQLLPHKREVASMPLRVACLASWTFESVRPALELQALRSGISLECHVAPFGQFDREVLEPESNLHRFDPQVLILALRLPDLCPDLYEAFAGLSSARVKELTDGYVSRIESLLAAFRSRSGAPVLLQDCERPAHPALGLADAGARPSQIGTILDMNQRLARLAVSVPNVYLMDYDALFARHGRAAWGDPRMQLTARIPVAPANYWALAGFYVRHLRPLVGLVRKVLVVDADDTLWGGVAGEVGLEGIALGPDYPGNAFVLLQKRLLDLHHRGVLLCLASKNEPAVVDEVIDRHPAMVLRREHFAARRINWSPKPDNLRAVADEINLGLESFVFLDDSEVECALMRRTLPQVLTIQAPREPALLPGTIESLDVFDQWTISEEDRRRGAAYHAESARREARVVSTDLPSFYRSLKMVMTLSIDEPGTIARAAQLTQRTNQFNMNPRRCTEEDIRGMMSAADEHVVCLSLRDRFGDSGIVGLAALRRGGQDWYLPMFLMSCRVLGRSAEGCFLRWLGRWSKAGGARRLIAEYVPTTKNKPFGSFYEECGLSPMPDEGEAQRWAWALDEAAFTMPDWMKVEEFVSTERGR
jgi:FkbH-like protein